MINVLFFIQYHSMGSSSRGIQSGGRILDFGDICDEDFMRSIMKGRYTLMYQVGRNRLDSLKSMTLEQFEAIFYPRGFIGKLDNMKYLLGFSEIESPFRKEILQKYGALANQPKVSTTTKYNVNDIIQGTDGVTYLYLGNIASMKYYIDRELKANYSGHLYMALEDIMDIPQESIENFLRRATVNFTKFERKFLKTKRKAVVNKVYTGRCIAGLKKVDQLNIILPRNFMYSYTRNLCIIYEMEDK